MTFTKLKIIIIIYKIQVIRGINLKICSLYCLQRSKENVTVAGMVLMNHLNIDWKKRSQEKIGLETRYNLLNPQAIKIMITIPF